MASAEQKVLQYLNEAHASEQALTRVLESQIAIAPRGPLRDGLVTHLEETKGHARRVAHRLQQLDQNSHPVMMALGAAETVAGQIVALGKTPLDMIRGTGGAEKVLKNTKDACATEALEIATYAAIQQVALAAGDQATAALALSIRGDEEAMLQRLLAEIPALADSVLDGTYSVADTGAGEAAREVGKAGKRAVRKTGTSAKRNARKVPGVVRAEGEIKGAVASEDDLPIPGYDSLTVSEINGKLTDLSQLELSKIDAYERKRQGRSTLLNRISTLRSDEPWAGYDELTVPEVKAALGDADDELTKAIRSYEQAHKARSGILQATESGT